MECEQIRELLEAYVLDALEEVESAQVAAHLATCPDCRRLAQQLAETAHLLPHALAAASPLNLPAQLKERLLESIATGQPSVSTTNGGTVENKEYPILFPAGTQPSPLPSPAHGMRRFPAWFKPRVLSAVAAVLVLAVTLGWGFRLNLALAQERVLRAEFANLVSQQEIVLEVVDSNKTVKRLLRPPAGNSSAYGKVYTRPDLSEVVVMAARLPVPPPGEGYHLWLTQQGQMKLAGVLNTNEQGFGMLVFDAATNGPEYQSARITLQPLNAVTTSDNTILLWEASK
ncbi:MAG: hypothetical protein EXR62_18210 [Chloroflexi bacterium]|nr:hypothetical protein [Chloroflexota bacterium]